MELDAHDTMCPHLACRDKQVCPFFEPLSGTDRGGLSARQKVCSEKNSVLTSAES